MKTVARSLGVAVTALSLVMFAAPADAGTTSKKGYRVSTPNFQKLDTTVSSYNGTEKCDFASDVSAAVRFDGDFVYVRDDCADGRSAVAMVTWGSEKRICRNAVGKGGGWVRCKWSWPEAAAKQFTPGVYNADTGYRRWYWGNGVYFSEK